MGSVLEVRLPLASYAYVVVLPAGSADDGLLAHGVFPLARKREVFVRTLEEVVLPGLAKFGVEVQPARAWIADRLGVARRRPG